MADNAADGEEGKEKKGGLGLLGWGAAVILALALGGGGFYATYSGLLGGAAPAPADLAADMVPAVPTFLELDPLMITVGGEGSLRQLRFRAFLQLSDPAGAAQVAALQPRILDIFATYLRALGLETLENPAALLRIRAQLLRRLQLLAGPDAVSDLLIVDFVIA
ncbi:flagellar basal body-associated FliL family protein [Jannaschia formosa]|uniref:flagellar basal body-associated FliL family protein n=1 Tax=Jannaschia formosa TaxID=2259592 RepID=UPI000E1B8C1F|nr:flagellar basal body-associated FliL family protein [Jannaschia formosa]TFL18442.1 flagellar basal body protein FliL [Jannaschia formosa]